MENKESHGEAWCELIYVLIVCINLAFLQNEALQQPVLQILTVVWPFLAMLAKNIPHFTSFH